MDRHCGADVEPVVLLRVFGKPEYQAPQKEFSIPAKNPTEQIKEVSTSQLKDWMTAGQPFTLIDVREDNEWQAGHAAAAIHISRWTLSGKIGTVVPDKTARSCSIAWVARGRRRPRRPSENGLHKRVLPDWRV